MKQLISAEQLKRQLNKGTIIFDCRFRLNGESYGVNAYNMGHIAGAYYLDLNKDLSAPVKLHGGRHPLPDAEAFAAKLRAAGVNKQSSIVLYDDSRSAYAARAWWLMKWLGLENVQLLDGGFNAWQDLGEALDRRSPAVKSGTFSPNISKNHWISREQILATLADPQANQLTLIDSREAARYRGLEEPIDPIAGHIPGAVNYFWQEVTDERGFFKTPAQLEAHWLNLNKSGEIAVYCGSGVTACVNLLALEILGVSAKLYPGSWSDWCSYPTESPIELSV